jgi:putative protein kinase ArgK-like GTPase of G3E family
MPWLDCARWFARTLNKLGSQEGIMSMVGMYGVGGTGKTTTCKTLCNEFSHEYGGQVCYVEFESKGTSSKGLLEKVLMHLTNTSLEFLQRMNEGKVGF